MSDFDVELYWRDREHKKWVVVVEARAGEREVKYVTARDQEGAEQCAMNNSYLEGRRTAYARLATPRDLGCVAV